MRVSVTNVRVTNAWILAALCCPMGAHCHSAWRGPDPKAGVSMEMLQFMNPTCLGGSNLLLLTTACGEVTGSSLGNEIY